MGDVAPIPAFWHGVCVTPDIAVLFCRVPTVIVIPNTFVTVPTGCKFLLKMIRTWINDTGSFKDVSRWSLSMSYYRWDTAHSKRYVLNDHLIQWIRSAATHMSALGSYLLHCFQNGIAKWPPCDRTHTLPGRIYACEGIVRTTSDKWDHP